MTLVETLKEEIVLARNETSRVSEKISRTDNFLDAILEVQDLVRKSIEDNNKVYDIIYNYFSDIKPQDWIENGLKKEFSGLNETNIRFYNLCKSGPFYAGAKTVINEFKQSSDDLRELYNDFETFKIKLPNNSDFNDLVSKINII